jgi:DNA-directed RNA polymerase specialized sigma24 family protein
MTDDVDPPWWHSKFTPEAIEAKTIYYMSLRSKREIEEDRLRAEREVNREAWSKEHKGKTPAEVDAHVYELRSNGVQVKDIAIRAGVTVGTIHNRIKRHREVIGVPPGGHWS